MNLDVRYCTKCGNAYDIDVEHDKCKSCRGIKLKEDIECGNQKTL